MKHIFIQNAFYTQVMERSAWLDMLGGTVEYIESESYRTRTLNMGEGSDPPLVLLHGTGGHAEAWLKNMRPLAEGLPNREIHAIDFIGCGYSSAPIDIDYHLTDLMDQVEEFIHAIGYESAHIHGESLGGWVAGRIGIERPELVETIGLNTPGGMYHLDTEGAVSDETREESFEGLEDLIDRTEEMLDAGITREHVVNRMDWLFIDDPDEELVDIRHRIYQREEIQEVMVTFYDTLLRIDAPERDFTSEELRELDIPTLFIHTVHNPSSQIELAEYANSLLPNSEFHKYENSGHWPQYEEPERYNNHTIEFIQRYSE